jgi:hypothetical protein
MTPTMTPMMIPMKNTQIVISGSIVFSSGKEIRKGVEYVFSPHVRELLVF